MVAGRDERPRWSVMVPAHDAADHLADTLDSVLAHDLPGDTQVVVVDDRSGDDTVVIAERYADRGVDVVVNDRNLGATGNFNRCIELARGELVHLLHADDEVVPGFYPTMDAAFTRSDVVAAVCRCAYVDPDGDVLHVTGSEQPSGVWPDAAARLALTSVVRPPAIVVRRDAYEAVGGYREDLHHAADWEMWARLAAHGDVWFEDRVLARYRRHPGSDTGTWVRSGGNVVERMRVLDIIAQRAVETGTDARPRAALAYSAWYSGRLGWLAARAGDWTAATTQARGVLACAVGAVAGSTGPVYRIMGAT